MVRQGAVEGRRLHKIKTKVVENRKAAIAGNNKLLKENSFVDFRLIKTLPKTRRENAKIWVIVKEWSAPKRRKDIIKVKIGKNPPITGETLDISNLSRAVK